MKNIINYYDLVLKLTYIFAYNTISKYGGQWDKNVIKSLKFSKFNRTFQSESENKCFT